MPAAAEWLPISMPCQFLLKSYWVPKPVAALDAVQDEVQVVAPNWATVVAQRVPDAGAWSRQPACLEQLGGGNAFFHGHGQGVRAVVTAESSVHHGGVVVEMLSLLLNAVDQDLHVASPAPHSAFSHPRSISVMKRARFSMELDVTVLVGAGVVEAGQEVLRAWLKPAAVQSPRQSKPIWLQTAWRPPQSRACWMAWMSSMVMSFSATLLPKPDPSGSPSCAPYLWHVVHQASGRRPGCRRRRSSPFSAYGLQRCDGLHHRSGPRRPWPG